MKTFKDEVPTAPGFYVFVYHDEIERKVYITGKPTHHYANVYSYSVTMHNTRDKTTCHDCGEYVWVNNFSVDYCPIGWRLMTEAEIADYRTKLFLFDRK